MIMIPQLTGFVQRKISAAGTKKFHKCLTIHFGGGYNDEEVSAGARVVSASRRVTHKSPKEVKIWQAKGLSTLYSADFSRD